MRKTLFIALFGLMLVPTFTYASWWNPFTWGKAQVVQSVSFDSIPTTTLPEIKLEPATTTVVEKPAEKIVTQTIKVTDPALQARINTLVVENNTLKNQIKNLEAALSKYTASASVAEINAAKAKQVTEQQLLDQAATEQVALNAEQARIRDINRRIAELNFKKAQIDSGEDPICKGGTTTSFEACRQSQFRQIDVEIAKIQLERYQ